MPDGVQDDVGDVLVRQVVPDLAGLTAGRHDPGVAQDSQVLGDQRLAHPDGGDQFVNVLSSIGQTRKTSKPS